VHSKPSHGHQAGGGVEDPVTDIPCLKYHCTKSCTDNWDSCLLGPDSWPDCLVSRSSNMHTYKQLDAEVQTTEEFCFIIKSSSLPIKSPRFTELLTQYWNIFLQSRHKTGFGNPEFGLELNSSTKVYKKVLAVTQGRLSIAYIETWEYRPDKKAAHFLNCLGIFRELNHW